MKQSVGIGALFYCPFTFVCRYGRIARNGGLRMNNRNRNSDPTSELYQAILKLKTPEECYQFFYDLCTQAELKAMEQRYDVAKLLRAGKIYHDILEETSASSATISRVNRSLLSGPGGYELVFSRMEEEEK